jgi:hypothetical protein
MHTHTHTHHTHTHSSLCMDRSVRRLLGKEASSLQRRVRPLRRSRAAQAGLLAGVRSRCTGPSSRDGRSSSCRAACPCAWCCTACHRRRSACRTGSTSRSTFSSRMPRSSTVAAGVDARCSSRPLHRMLCSLHLPCQSMNQGRPNCIHPQASEHCCPFRPWHSPSRPRIHPKNCASYSERIGKEGSLHRQHNKQHETRNTQHDDCSVSTKRGAKSTTWLHAMVGE